MTLKRRQLMMALAASGLAVMAPQALAQGQGAWPSGPVRLIVPYAPGGAIDIITRVVADKLGPLLGTSIVVENKPGASTIVASTYVKDAKPDGSVFLITDTTHGANPALKKSLPYDTVKDFESVVMLAELPAVLIVPATLPVNNLQELIALARKDPGKLNYSSAGFGTINHLAAELFKKQFGLDIQQVTYSGGGPAITAIVAGEAQMLFIALPGAMPFITSGRVKAIAVTSAERQASLPNVPTVAESGFPGFSFVGNIGIRAPLRTPADIVARMNAAVNTVLAMPEVKARLSGAGADIAGGTPDRFTGYLRSEVAKWDKIITPDMRID